MAGKAKTNNSVERAHNSFRTLVGSSTPKLYTVVRRLKQRINEMEIEVQRQEAYLFDPRVQKKYELSLARIKNVLADLPQRSPDQVMEALIPNTHAVDFSRPAVAIDGPRQVASTIQQPVQPVSQLTSTIASNIRAILPEGLLSPPSVPVLRVASRPLANSHAAGSSIDLRSSPPPATSSLHASQAFRSMIDVSSARVS